MIRRPPRSTRTYTSFPTRRSSDLVTCDPLGFPRSILHEMRGMELVQSPDKVTQLLQYQRTFREIWTDGRPLPARSEEHTSELQSLMRISYAVFCLKKKTYI